MFELTDEDKNFLHGDVFSRENRMSCDEGMLLCGTPASPFYLQSKKSWEEFLEIGLSVPARKNGERNKSLHNAAFGFCGADFFLGLLIDSIDHEGRSMLSPGIQNNVQQAVAVQCHTLFEAVGSMRFRTMNLQGQKHLKDWQVGICHLASLALPQSKSERKASEFEKLSEMRNRIHQDKVDGRPEDYFSRMSPYDLVLPVRALQKIVVSIWRQHPESQYGQPRKLLSRSPFCANNLVPTLQLFAEKRKKDFRDFISDTEF